MRYAVMTPRRGQARRIRSVWAMHGSPMGMTRGPKNAGLPGPWNFCSSPKDRTLPFAPEPGRTGRPTALLLQPGLWADAWP